jgi:hypothetical protein
MSEVMLAVDAILAVIIGNEPERIDQLIEEARRGDIELLILQEALYWALYSVREDDPVDMVRLAELVRCARIQNLDEPDSSQRRNRKPSQEEVNHWRAIALQSL